MKRFETLNVLRPNMNFVDGFPKMLLNPLFLYLTLKKLTVDPDFKVPYSIAVCLAKSSAPDIGEAILSIVRKAARLAVYDEMMMRVKNHHTAPTIRPENCLQIGLRKK